MQVFSSSSRSRYPAAAAAAKASIRKEPDLWKQKQRFSSKSFEEPAPVCSEIPHQRYWRYPNSLSGTELKLWEAGDDGLVVGSMDLSMFSKLEHLDEALEAIESLLNHGVQLPSQAFYLLLKECNRKKDKDAGRKVQTLAAKSGLETNLFLANHLIRFFSSCGSLIEAVKVFCKLPKKDSHIWTSMIAAYSKHGQGDKSIKLYHEMRDSLDKPDVHTFVAVLNACVNTNSLTQGYLIHTHILQNGLDSNVYIGNSLINMYSKCGRLVDAQKVFKKMSIQDAITWNTMIAGCAHNGDGQGALDLYIRMQHQGFRPDRVTFISTLKACGSIAALDRGKRIHEQVITSGLELDPFLGSTLIDMYAKCGALDEARKVFYKLPKLNVVSCNAMIAGCLQHGHSQEAFHFFEEIQKKGQKPDKVTFLCILKACGSLGSLNDGERIHALLEKSGLGSDKFVGSALIDMYGKCGSTDKAWEVFRKLHGRDIILWNTMIEAFAENGNGHDALELFQTMQHEGLKPDKVTFVSVLKACGSAEDLTQGKRIHKQVLCAHLASDLFINNTLIDMYVKCGSVVEAYQIFTQLRDRDIVSYNVMIAGCVKHAHNREAVKLFEKLKLEGLHPNKSTFVSMLKSYGNLLDLERGKLLHGQVSESGLESDIFVGSAIVDMYAKCGSLDEALKMFRKLSKRDVVAWTALISGYAEHGEGQKAFLFFEKMKQEGLKPTKVTYLSILKACASISNLNQGKIIHAELLEKGLQNDMFIGSALIDMYVKCGSLEEAHKVFLILPERDTVLWNSMVSGYAQHGQGERALKLFKKMQEMGVEPDEVTFLCILSACSHAGMLDESYRIFEQMCRTLGVTPAMEHYACMVDLLGRAGI
ncbi:hypothetical protein O6H91_14G027300 [Diphasiastrum complanatum]|uniref:Uncharacterized protein n=3 Tax=Diphasiastrum complanatum TaxID=34168 RepID=A0ACC2BMJ0_DIPCM|nr:hypothetical protein O6H91_14G027300 [Diphasiastrum complanatum]KAJ7530983.1 hypothetical protein O6H91_14G027300 [Diphasiastrum complanatum]KAJ7530987.1 hypothetical protein O6H91_14G027300 [Diphasiastrum complanatum]